MSPTSRYPTGTEAARPKTSRTGWERPPPGGAECYEVLAFHCAEAHRYALESDRAAAEPLRRRALDYLLLAARQANARLAVSAAQRLSDRALALASGGREP